MRRSKDDKLIKKLSGHELFYHDKDYSDYKFYTKLNSMYDISLLVYHPKELTFREFILDIASFITLYEFATQGDFSVHSRFVKPGARPMAIRPLIELENYRLIKTGESKIIKSYIVAKVTEFKTKDDTLEALDLKRFVVKPVKGSPIIGADSITIPKDAAVELIQKVKTMFKEIDIDIELEEILHDQDYDNGRYKQ